MIRLPSDLDPALAEARAVARIRVLAGANKQKVDPLEDLDTIACSELVSVPTRTMAVGIAAQYIDAVVKDEEQETRAKRVLLRILRDATKCPAIQRQLERAWQRVSQQG